MAVSHGAAQKQQELACMKIALDARKSQKGESKRILDLLDGEEVPRESDERPDFVRRTLPKSKRDKGVLLGIEHFRVDCLSLQKKDGKVASTGAKLFNDFAKVQTAWEQLQTGQNSDENVQGAMNVIDARTKIESEIFSTNYQTLLAAFESTLSKHIDQIPKYYENLNSCSYEGEEIQFAFLIDLRIEYKSLVIKGKNGFKKGYRCKPPLYVNIVQILERFIDPRKVNYVILCLNNTVGDAPSQVIAVKTKEIRKNICAQHIPLFEYLSMDRWIEPFAGRPMNMRFSCVNTVVNRENNILENVITTKVQRVDDIFFNKLMEVTAYYVSVCDRCNRNYVISPIELIFAYSIIPEVREWNEGTGNEYWMASPIYFDSNMKTVKSRVYERSKAMKKIMDNTESKEFQAINASVPQIIKKGKNHETAI